MAYAGLVALYEFRDPGPLQRPVLIVALDGWVNAGEAGTEAVKTLAADAEEIAVFDSDALFDYRANRPTIDFVEGVMSSVIWPQLTMKKRSYRERDVVVLTGAEPNWNWQHLGHEIADLGLRLGITEHISLGGLPWAAPHTRPITTIITASDSSRISPGNEHPEGLLRVPGAAVSAIEHAVASSGIPTIGFWARVPQYIGAAFHAAALALVERTAAHLGIVVDISELAETASEQAMQLDAIVEARPDVKTMVARLESVYDTEGAVSGEQLAAEIERFLREGGGEEGIGR